MREQLLQALIEQSSSYKIEVSDNSMLPEKIKNKKTIDFIVKPPVLSVLAKCAIILDKIPNELKQENKQLELYDVLNYVNEMAQVFAILAHGKTTDYPNWYIAFLVNNVTPKELFDLFREMALKTQSGFFLKSSQIASAINPMMMT